MFSYAFDNVILYVYVLQAYFMQFWLQNIQHRDTFYAGEVFGETVLFFFLLILFFILSI